MKYRLFLEVMVVGSIGAHLVLNTEVWRFGLSIAADVALWLAIEAIGAARARWQIVRRRP